MEGGIPDPLEVEAVRMKSGAGWLAGLDGSDKSSKALAILILEIVLAWLKGWFFAELSNFAM